MKQSDIQNVSIQLKSRIDGKDTEYFYYGEYCFKDGSHCIAYTDHMGNAVTKVGIESNEKAMLIHRVGYITTDMLFDPSGETIVKYDALSLKRGFVLRTHNYRIENEDTALTIHVEYSLHDGSGEPAIQGSQDMTITLMEVQENEKNI